MKLSLLKEEVRRFHSDKIVVEPPKPSRQLRDISHGRTTHGGAPYQGSYSGYEIWGDFEEEECLSLQCTKGEQLAHWRCLAHWCKCPCHTDTDWAGVYD